MNVICDYCGEAIIMGEEIVELPGETGPLRMHMNCVEAVFKKVHDEELVPQ